WVLIEAEGGEDCAGEGADQVVGEQVGAGFFGEDLRDAVRAGVEVVAVQAGEALYAAGVADLVQGAVGAAVGVGQHRAGAVGLGSRDDTFGMLMDFLWTVVEAGGQRAHDDRPAATGGYLPDVGGQCATGDDLKSRARE